MNIKKGIILISVLVILYNIIPYTETKIKTAEIEKTDEIIIENVSRDIEVTNRSAEREIEEPIKVYAFNNETDLTIKTNIQAEEYNIMLEDTVLNEIGEYIYNAEQTYNVNGLYIMGLACLESAYGTSSYAKNRNNLFGWNAVDSNPNKATYFESKESCIMYVTEKLANNYLSENGCYFSGYTAKDIDKHYCTDKQHANKIINIVNKLLEKVV